MADIQLQLVVADLKERLLNADALIDLPQAVHRRLAAAPRLYQAIGEAVYDFVLQANATRLGGYVADSLFELEDTGTTPYRGLCVYAWPAPAFTERQDGGVLNLVLNGHFFDTWQMDSDRPALPRDIMSLQHQAQSDLLYGPGYRNAIADVYTGKIYVPAGVTALAQIIEAPPPLPLEKPFETEVPISTVYQEWITGRAFQYLLGNVAGIGTPVIGQEMKSEQQEKEEVEA